MSARPHWIRIGLAAGARCARCRQVLSVAPDVVRWDGEELTCRSCAELLEGVEYPSMEVLK